jgi:hypothetical protein
MVKGVHEKDDIFFFEQILWPKSDFIESVYFYLVFWPINYSVVSI